MTSFHFTRETELEDFEELLQTRLKPFLDQGVTVLSEETYNRILEEQMAKYLGYS